MDFIKTLELRTHGTETTNGQYAVSTTTNHLLDFYGTVGALRDADKSRIIRLFEAAIAEDMFLATVTMFYARDIREGVGEREVFRTLLSYAADKHPEMVIPNIPLIGYYGRYDDLYALMGTKCEDDMWKYMGEQLKTDYNNMLENKPVTLLAKWIKTPDASSETTRALGILTSMKLGFKNVKEFKRVLKPLRKYLSIPEIAISAEKFESIAYDKVPSNAMMKYRELFFKKDGERFNRYLEEVKAGTKTINSGTLFPYDFVREVFHDKYDESMEVQWKNLPNYVEDGSNILVMADVSGSMTCCNGRPIFSSIGLAIYFAEKAKGPFHNKFMTFSEHPTLETITGDNLAEKISMMECADWGMNTNLGKAMRVILDTAIETKVRQEKIPKALVIISDMEFDRATDDGTLFYDHYKKEYENAGYEMPNVVFWNVNSTNDVFHVACDTKGVQLVSGNSTTTFKNLLACLNSTPVEAMMHTLLSSRYSPIVVGGLEK